MTRQREEAEAMQIFGISVVERPGVPPGTALLVSPGVVAVPAGLSFEALLELVVVDLTAAQRVGLIEGIGGMDA